MIDFNNKGFFKLKQNDEYAERVKDLLLDGETVIDAYKSMRDGVVFTTKRIISVNVQGLTGSKKDFTSLPYKNIVAWSVETSGTFDLDSELEIYYSAIGKVKFEFTGKTSMVEISRYIAQHLLGWLTGRPPVCAQTGGRHTRRLSGPATAPRRSPSADCPNDGLRRRTARRSRS